VAHCHQADCSTGATLTAVDSVDGVARSTSVAIGADGLPVISYCDDTVDDLKVAHCNDATCSGATITTVDIAGGWHSSIAITDNGLPVISYLDNANDHLRVARCEDAACTSAKLTTVDNTGHVGLASSMAIGALGGPVISYANFYHDLKVAFLPY